MGGEILGWELLHGSDTDSIDSHPSDENSCYLRQIDGVPIGTIRSGHFSIDHLSENDLFESDNSGCLDPALESSNEVLADSSADLSSNRQWSDARVSNELGFIDGSDREIVSESFRDLESKTEILGDSGSDDCKLRDFGIAGATQVESRQAVAEEFRESHLHDDDSSMCWSNSGQEEGLVPSNSDEINLATTKMEESAESDSRIASSEEMVGRGGNNINEEQEESVMNLDSESEGKKKSVMVWWKMPFVLLKYCVFKIRPVWSVSMAATVVGLALLGRRLYSMNKKAQRFQLKVAMDDKKAWKVMGEAARLNEAFTEVRRVPIIRPALPAPATNPWPLLSLR